MRVLDNTTVVFYRDTHVYITHRFTVRRLVVVVVVVRNNLSDYYLHHYHYRLLVL